MLNSLQTGLCESLFKIEHCLLDYVIMLNEFMGNPDDDIDDIEDELDEKSKASLNTILSLKNARDATLKKVSSEVYCQFIRDRRERQSLDDIQLSSFVRENLFNFFNADLKSFLSNKGDTYLKGVEFEKNFRTLCLEACMVLSKPHESNWPKIQKGGQFKKLFIHALKRYTGQSFLFLHGYPRRQKP